MPGRIYFPSATRTAAPIQCLWDMKSTESINHKMSCCAWTAAPDTETWRQADRRRLGTPSSGSLRSLRALPAWDFANGPYSRRLDCPIARTRDRTENRVASASTRGGCDGGCSDRRGRTGRPDTRLRTRPARGALPDRRRRGAAVALLPRDRGHPAHLRSLGGHGPRPRDDRRGSLAHGSAHGSLRPAAGRRAQSAPGPALRVARTSAVRDRACPDPPPGALRPAGRARPAPDRPGAGRCRCPRATAG